MMVEEDVLRNELIKVPKDHDVLAWLTNENTEKAQNIYLLLYGSRPDFHKLINNPQHTAIALYSIPGKNKFPELPGFELLFKLKRIIGWSKLFDFIKRQQKVGGFLPDGPKIRLHVFWVQQEYRRQGAGTDLMQKLIEESISADLPVLLETSCRSALSFFASLDFDVYFTWQDPFLGKPVYFMRRMPCGC